MAKTDKIQKLSLIAESLLKATSVVQQATSAIQQSTLYTAINDLFNTLPLEILSDRRNEPGFEQTGTFLQIIDAAKTAFLNDDRQAIRITTRHVKNDTNGNNHTEATVTFAVEGQSVLLRMVLVEMRESNSWTSELSFLDNPYSFLLNGEPVSPELEAFLLGELEGMADAYITGNLSFPHFDTAADIEAAQALIDKYLPVLVDNAA